MKYSILFLVTVSLHISQHFSSSCQLARNIRVHYNFPENLRVLASDMYNVNNDGDFILYLVLMTCNSEVSLFFRLIFQLMWPKK